jgi:hypothetical protein
MTRAYHEHVREPANARVRGRRNALSVLSSYTRIAERCLYNIAHSMKLTRGGAE